MHKAVGRVYVQIANLRILCNQVYSICIKMHIFCSRNLAKIGPQKSFLKFFGTLLELLKKKKPHKRLG